MIGVDRYVSRPPLRPLDWSGSGFDPQYEGPGTILVLAFVRESAEGYLKVVPRGR